MNPSARHCRFVVCLFLFAVSLPFPGARSLAQDIPAPGPPPAARDAQPAQVPAIPPRGGELQAEELLRVLELPAVRKALALTDEQQGKIEDISFNVRRAVIIQQAELQVRRLELERMMRADAPDRAAVDRKVQEVADAQTAMLRARVNALMDLRGVLTKEQTDRIKEFLLQRIERAAKTRAQQAQPKQQLPLSKNN